MTMQFTPDGFPAFTTNTLPVQWAITVLDERKSKPWKNCQNCLESPSSVGLNAFHCCENCAQVRCADPARYCVCHHVYGRSEYTIV